MGENANSNALLEAMGTLTAGSVLFQGASGVTQDSGFTYDATNDILSVSRIRTGDGSAALPFLAPTSDPDTGIYAFGTNALGVATGGNARFLFSSAAVFQLINSGALEWSGSVLGATSDVRLFRDSGGILASRNGTNPQVFRIYNTFTSSSDYERLVIGWSSNILFIGNEAAGGGSARAMVLGTTGTSELRFNTSGTNRWIMSSTALTAVLDNTYDIGATGATRPRRLYLGTSINLEANNAIILTNQTNGAGVAVGSLTNTPAAGNPAFWLPVTVNGTNRWIPCW